MKPDSSQRSLWPYGIFATLLLFGGGIAALAVTAVSHHWDLVRSDYYEHEIRYQEQIDRESRTASIGAKPVVSYDVETAQVNVRLPGMHAVKQPTGTLHLYRPSDAGLDREVPLLLDDEGAQQIDVATLRPGLWKLEITWRVDGIDYSSRHSLVLGQKGA
jgi:nitrogen fixation protein FixH